MRFITLELFPELFEGKPEMLKRYKQAVIARFERGYDRDRFPNEMRIMYEKQIKRRKKCLG